MPFLPIRTERLELRALTMADAPAAHRFYGDPEVMRWVAGGALPDLAATEAMLRQVIAHERLRGFSWWAVVELASGELVGDAGLSSYAGRGPGVEMGYTFAREAWGKGYATEAAIASLRAAFGPLGLRRVVAVVRPENVASQRVLQKAGMVPDGRVDYHGAEHLRYSAGRRSWRVPERG
jgi:ribosomal-protein-alanine N-acetyltransferase